MKTYVLTIPINQVTKRELLFRLRNRSGGKRWQFGIEVGSRSGYEHYQVRYECSCNDYETERNYWTGIKCELQEAGGWSEYELKSGNFWSWMDDELGKYRFGRLQELQLCILAHGRCQSDRLITAVVDNAGNTGKTWLARYMALNNEGIYIDGSGKASDIIGDVYDISEYRKISKCFIDLTRNADHNRRDLWSAIEQIKNGYLKDRRYTLREKWIKPPVLFVFTNHDIDTKLLSSDRWDMIYIHDRNGVIKMYDYPKDKEGYTYSRVRNFYRNN